MREINSFLLLRSLLVPDTNDWYGKRNWKNDQYGFHFCVLRYPSEIRAADRGVMPEGS